MGFPHSPIFNAVYGYMFTIQDHVLTSWQDRLLDNCGTCHQSTGMKPQALPQATQLGEVLALLREEV